VGYTEQDATPPVDPVDPVDPTPTTTCRVSKWWRNCTTARRVLADTEGDSGYFKVQNSWGSSWGNQGFVKIAIEAGSGPCMINSYMYFVNW